MRLKYFMSCDDIDEGVPPIEFILNALGDDSVDKNKVFRTADTLVDIGCDLNEHSAIGLTPLQGAVVISDPLATEYLLNRGADPYLEAIDGTLTLIETTPITEYTGLNSFELSKNQIVRLTGDTRRNEEYSKALKVADLLEQNKNIKSKGIGRVNAPLL